MTLLEELESFINETKDCREQKRAMAVKMQLEGKSYQEIQKLLSCSQSFISKWKNTVIFSGVSALKIQYKGGKSYLSPEDKEEIITWIKTQDWITREELELEIEKRYGVVFSSLQSYYDLLKEADMGWKKTQKKNTRKNPELIKAKREEIKEKLRQWQPEIIEGKLTVFMIDECHLLWEDILGYVWGKKSIRIEIPIKNEKERQTYYGALDYQNKEFLVKAYEAGNSENTKKFLDYLQEQRPGQRIVVIWDGAKYHDSQEIREYLSKLNKDKLEENWQITCIKLAPNAPEQNPVEDIWLQAKNLLRKFYKYCDSFKLVKYLFEFFTHGQIFDFPKLFEYDIFTQPV